MPWPRPTPFSTLPRRPDKPKNDSKNMNRRGSVRHGSQSGVGPLARYGNHQEIISRRLEEMYASSDTRLEWPRVGPLFKSDSNKHQGLKTGALFE